MKGIALRTQAEITAPPDTITQVVLASSAAQAFDIPAGANYAGFSFNTDVWVKFSSTGALVPSTSSSAGSSGSELNPNIRNFGSTAGSTGLSIIAAVAGAGSIAWWSK